MELKLHEHPLPQVFAGGVSVDNMTWWFWIKAGIGFTLGAGLVTIAAMTAWTIIGWTVIYNLFRR